MSAVVLVRPGGRRLDPLRSLLGPRWLAWWRSRAGHRIRAGPGTGRPAIIEVAGADPRTPTSTAPLPGIAEGSSTSVGSSRTSPRRKPTWTRSAHVCGTRRGGQRRSGYVCLSAARSSPTPRRPRRLDRDELARADRRPGHCRQCDTRWSARRTVRSWSSTSKAKPATPRSDVERHIRQDAQIAEANARWSTRARCPRLPRDTTARTGIRRGQDVPTGCARR